ncbi:MAG TPA: creatininase family protein [Gemmatimonadaceae bacterium]|nr:creatininase family protein [Gemmatimonadaceae bacterium]
MTASLPLQAPATNARLLKYTPPGAVAEILARDPRLIIPVGTCEQHGPHLPLGCATIIAEKLSDDLSATYGVLRAPTIEYGVNVGTARDFVGNASMRRKTLHRLLNDLLASWEDSGFREFILITAHDHDPHQDALSTVITREARVRVVDLYAIRLDDLLEGQSEHMHGDEADTSLMLHIAPELVRMDWARDYMMSREQLRRYRRGYLRVPKESAGSIGRPSLATAEKGRAMYERILQRVAERIFLSPALEA